MRGWERVGTLFDAGFMFNTSVRPGDILRLSPYEDEPLELRAGSIRARDTVALKWHELRSLIPAAADGDNVFRATALGEHAFSRGEPSDPVAPP